MIRILGAILAGGASSRFGSDKAMALLDGKPLIAHVREALAAQTDALVVCGRAFGDLISLPDRPVAQCGPLGGLCAALHYAAENSFDAVVTAGCDTPILPADLARRLGEAPPAFAEGQYLIGCWPSALAETLDAHLARSEDRSMRGWISLIGGRAIPFAAIPNINRAGDLDALNAQEFVA